MNSKLEQQADELLKRHGFSTNGEPVNASMLEGDDMSLNGILANYDFFEKREEVTHLISGSFATRKVHQDELAYAIDLSFIKNHKSVGILTNFEWRLYSRIVPRYLLSGYGVFHYQFIAKQGIYLALYKLNDDEQVEYEANYFLACEQYGMDRYDLMQMRKLYGIDQEMEKVIVVAGNCYVTHDKKITKTTHNKLEKWFAKYKMELSKSLKR